MNLNDADRAIEEFRRALSSGNAEAIARTAMNNVWPLYTSHIETLIPAVQALPSSLLERYPILKMMHPMTAVLARTTRPFKPLVYPDDARAMDPDELDLLTVVQMIAFRSSGDVAGALIYARRLGDRILQSAVESHARADGPLWFYHYQIGTTLLAAGDSSRALLEFGTARQLGAYSKQPYSIRMALGREALAHAVRGSLDEAERALSELAEHPLPTAAHLRSALAGERAAAALIAVERMDDYERRLTELEPFDSIQMSWPFALLARARALLAVDEPQHAREQLQLAKESHPPQHGAFASDVISALTIKALVMSGDLRRARSVADESRNNGVLTSVATVRVYILEGRFDAATQLLGAITADASTSPAQRTECVCLAAWVEWARTDALESETVNQVFNAVQRGDARRILASLPEGLIEQIAESLPAERAAVFNEVMRGLSPLRLRKRPKLTSSELRVLRGLTIYPTTAEIAAAFHVSPNTVKSQLKSLYRKLDCSTRSEAISAASRLNLLTSEPHGTDAARLGAGDVRVM